MNYDSYYLIFADILFDVLDEKPQDDGKKFALVRYEDVSAKSTSYIKTMTDLFYKMRVPFAISLIPVYVDPLKTYKINPYMEIANHPEFINLLNYAREHGASFILHGITHQYDHKKDPFSGVTGEDYEFWDYPAQHAIQGDSVKLVLDRLLWGTGLVRQAGFSFDAWMTPHYLSSSLDDIVFGQVFAWNVGKDTYRLGKVCGLNPLSDTLTLDHGNGYVHAASLQANLAPLKFAEVANARDFSQFYPYTIYGDYYDRRVIPESLGNIQPFLSNQVVATRTVDEIIADARRYKVLRDSWASFFVHDILLNAKNNNGLGDYPGDTKELERLLTTIKSLGYEFIDLKKWTKTHLKAKAPRAIEIDPFPGNCWS